MKKLICILLCMPFCLYGQDSLKDRLDALYANAPVAYVCRSPFQSEFCAALSLGVVTKRIGTIPKTFYVSPASRVCGLQSYPLCLLYDSNMEVYQSFAIVRGKDTSYVSKACLHGDPNACMGDFYAYVVPTTDRMYISPTGNLGHNYWGPVPQTFASSKAPNTISVYIQAIALKKKGLDLVVVPDAFATKLAGENLANVLKLIPEPDDDDVMFDDLYITKVSYPDRALIGARVIIATEDTDYIFGFVEDIITTPRNNFLIIERIQP